MGIAYDEHAHSTSSIGINDISHIRHKNKTDSQEKQQEIKESRPSDG